MEKNKEVELEKMKLEEQSQEQKRKAVIVKNCLDCHEDFSTNRADNFERCSTCRWEKIKLAFIVIFSKRADNGKK